MQGNGFSSDGYIIDQDCFGGFPYRTMSSDINGCGWIAAFDLRRALGQEADFNAVREELDAMFPLWVPGPTSVGVLCRYLRRYVPELRVEKGREDVLSAALASRAGILRYWEGSEPHFVAFVRQSGSTFRFFNVADGLEDMLSDMGDFIRSRCLRFGVLSMTVE